MHSQDKTASPSAEEDGGKYHSGKLYGLLVVIQ
jgi:hypothetical protein